MALKDILEMSSGKKKKIGVSEERIEPVKKTIR